MTNEITGGCGCGAVNFRIAGSIKAVVNCHCDSCRRYNGAAYSTYCVVKQGELNVLEGPEKISFYEMLGSGKKHVCSACGSPLYNAHDNYPGMYMVYYGSLSRSFSEAPNFNVHCENKLSWVDGIAQIRSFQQAVERA